MALLRTFASRPSLISVLRRGLRKRTPVDSTLSCLAPRLYQSTLQTTDAGFVDVSMKTDVAVLHMKRSPANALNLELLTQLNSALEKLDGDQQCRGLIITSGVPNIFSIGLDIAEMYQPDKTRLAETWKMLQNFWIALYGSRLMTVAAINGDSVAAGCLLALACDHRVMVTEERKIGMNEILLGMVVPFWHAESLQAVIGHRASERALQRGLVYSPPEALRVGLIDCLTMHGEALQQSAEREVTRWLQVPDSGRAPTKHVFRRSLVDRLVARRDQDVESFVSLVTKDSIQRKLARHLETMKKDERNTFQR